MVSVHYMNKSTYDRTFLLRQTVLDLSRERITLVHNLNILQWSQLSQSANTEWSVKKEGIY